MYVQMIVVATVGIAVETSSPHLMTYTKIKYILIIAIHFTDVKIKRKDNTVIYKSSIVKRGKDRVHMCFQGVR